MEIVVLLKPDIIENNQIAEIKTEIKENLGQIKESKMISLDKTFLQEFYKDHRDKDYFQTNIVENMTRTPIIAMLIDTKITDFDIILGIKNKIRWKYAKDKSNNSIHISDSLISAENEKKLLGLNRI